MMANKLHVSIKKSNQFEITFKNLLAEYASDVFTVTRLATKDTADWAVDKLKQRGDFNGTKYKKSWTSEVQQTVTWTNATVYNKEHYRLSHLLEFGHVKQNGGRTKEFPHIAPTSKEAEAYFMKRIEWYVGGIDSIFSKGK